jgi:hypothetical protein
MLVSTSNHSLFSVNLMGLFYFVFQLSLGFLPSPWLTIYILCVLLNITSHVLSSFTLQFFTTFWSLEVQKLKYLSRFKPLMNTMVHNHSNANKHTDFEHSYLLLFIYFYIFTSRYQFTFLWLLIYVYTKIINKQTNKNSAKIHILHQDLNPRVGACPFTYCSTCFT